MKAKLLLCAGMLMLAAHVHADDKCQVSTGFRLTSQASVTAAAEACEVNGPIGVFTTGVKEITLKNVKRAKFINIDAEDLEAVAFPQLEEVDFLYVQGGDLRVLELPKLKYVKNTLYVKSKDLRFLNLPSLRTVWKWWIAKNPNLEAVFAEKLQDVGVLTIEGNPKLAPGNAEALQGVTRAYSAEERKAILEAEQRLREVKLKWNEQMRANQPILPPTGHPTYFGGATGFYQAYPYYYYNYWHTIRPYGYGWWYWR